MFLKIVNIFFNLFRGFTKVKAEEELKRQIAVSDNYQFDDSNKKQDSDAIAMGEREKMRENDFYDNFVVFFHIFYTFKIKK